MCDHYAISAAMVLAGTIHHVCKDKDPIKGQQPAFLQVVRDIPLHFHSYTEISIRQLFNMLTAILWGGGNCWKTKWTRGHQQVRQLLRHSVEKNTAHVFTIMEAG